MQHRDRHAEAFAKASHQLRREADLGHQHQCAPAVTQCALDGVQVNLGLAAAGDAVQQERRKTRVRGIDRGDRGRLFVGERGAKVADQICRCECARGFIGALGGRGEAARHEGAHRRAPVGKFFRQRFAGHAVGGAQDFEEFALARRARQSVFIERRDCRPRLRTSAR